jgi:large subunit ribosomal protein L5
MNRLKEKYQQEIVEQLKKEFGLTNIFSVPTVKKIVVSMGVSSPTEPRDRKKALENISEQFMIITGQKPVMTVARKAIANFGLRAGDPMGLTVTLRGERMWQFLDKLISIVLPRVKDFRGISKTAFDGRGNYSLGLEEQIVFPEINYDKIERVRGLQVNIVTSANDDQQSLKLLELLGMPFAKDN